MSPGYPITSLQKAYLQWLLLSGTSCLTTTKTPEHTKRQNNVTRQTVQASETRHGRDIEMIRPECKTTMINMLRALMDNVDSIQEEVHKEGRDACIL